MTPVHTRVRRLILAAMAALLLAAALASGTAAPATAVEGGTTTYNVTTSPNIYDATPVLLRQVPSRQLQAGQTIFLQGRVAATSTATQSIGQVAQIHCLNGSGQIVGSPARATRNHEGQGFPYAIPGQLHVLVDYTFTAPSTGTYTCGLYTLAWDSVAGNLRIVPNESRILVSNEIQPGAHRRDQAVCNSVGDSPGCLYIGAPGYDDTTWPLYTGQSSQVWTMDPAATQVEARGVLELTNCYQGTASCINAVDQYGDFDWSTVRLELQLIQLTAQNTTCHVFSSRPAGDPLVVTITDGAHHYAQTEVIAAVTPVAGCPRNFIVRFRVTHGSGNPVKVDGTAEGFLQTNASIFNRY